MTTPVCAGVAMAAALRAAVAWVTFGLLASLSTPAAALDAAPQRKAGWWQMTSQLPGGRTMQRNLCLDATSDARHDIFKPAGGCTMSAQRIDGGYRYLKACNGETTSGTAIGDFNSAYRISESQGTMHITTDARWMGACPAGHAVDSMW